MLAIFKKKWAWIAAIFLIISIAGLLKIISLAENKQCLAKDAETNIVPTVKQKVRQVIWPAKKKVKETIKKVKKNVQRKEKDMFVKYVRVNMSGSDPFIYINFSEDINIRKIKGYIEVTPKINFYAEDSYYYHGIRLCGNFKSGVSYTIEMLKGMPSANGATLKKTVTRSVVIPDCEPGFSFKVPGMYMSLKGNQTMPLEVVNVDKLKIKLHRVYDNNIVYLLNNKRHYSFPNNLGLDVVEKEIKTEYKRNEKKEVLIDLKELLADNSHGLFYMTINKPNGHYYRAARKLILTTDIGIVAKKSDSGLLVWLNSLSTTSAVSGAVVKVFTKTNQQVLEGVTDENGLAHFKDVDWSGDRKPFIITAATEDDLSFIEVDKCVLSETAFDTGGRPYLNTNYEAFLYSDRGISRLI